LGIDSPPAPLALGRYRGSPLRRQALVGTLVLSVTMVIWPNRSTWLRPGADAGELLACLALAAIIEIVFTRRMGFIVKENRLVLAYAWGWHRMAWADIERFEWRPYMRSTTQALYAITDHGKMRIPSMAYVNQKLGWTGARHVSMPPDLAEKTLALQATADERHARLPVE
jgi:hypothetical protein